MKGGFNKILRNIEAGSSDTEYEKVSGSCNHQQIITQIFTIETDQGDISPW